MSRVVGWGPVALGAAKETNVIPLISEGAVEPIVGALVGAADVEGGPTGEQRAIIETLVVGCWGRDKGLVGANPLSPVEVGKRVTDEGDRRRLRELLVMVEFCAHPITEGRLASTETYARAISQSGPGLALARDLVRASAEETYQDYLRLNGLSNDPGPSPEPIKGPDPLRVELEGYQSLPPTTLGWAFLDFHLRNGFALPNSSPMGQVFLRHDTTHVIAGYEPTGEGEIALGAMMLSAADTDRNWLGFLGNLLVHEVGHVVPGFEHARPALLDHGLGRTMLAEGFRRGATCNVALDDVDLLRMAEWELDDVRREFCVPALGSV
jgi:hypothetical protein